MGDFASPPRKDEVQYIRDLARGRRKIDASVIVAFGVAGALIGIPVGIAGSSADGGSVDPAFIVVSAAVCGLTLAVIAGVVLASVRSIAALCRAWLPARAIVGIACAFLLLRVVQRVQLIAIAGIGNAVPSLVLNLLWLVFGVLLLNLGMRLVFSVYCMVRGRDDEEIVARGIAADDDREKRG